MNVSNCINLFHLPLQQSGNRLSADYQKSEQTLPDKVRGYVLHENINVLCQI